MEDNTILYSLCLKSSADDYVELMQNLDSSRHKARFDLNLNLLLVFPKRVRSDALK